MKRLALLIGSPSHPKTPKAGKYLEGVKTDIENIQNFLTTSIGGSWKNEEVFAFSPNPSYEDVLPYLEKCENVDFAFIYFSGHGYTDKEDKTRVVFNEKQAPEVIKHLANRAKHQVTIIDACRTYPEFIGFDGVPILEGIEFPNPNPRFARSMFDSYISKLPASRVLLCATSKGNPSMDYGSKYGGLFSSSLLTVVKEKLKAENKPIYNVAEVFKNAKINTQKYESKQRPEIYISDENAYKLPFAIKPDYKPEKAKSFEEFTNEKIDSDIIKGLVIGAAAVLTGMAIGSILTGKKK